MCPLPALRPEGVLVHTAFSLISAGTERAKVEVARKNLLGKALARPDQVRQVLESVRQLGLAATLQKVTANWMRSVRWGIRRRGGAGSGGAGSRVCARRLGGLCRRRICQSCRICLRAAHAVRQGA